MTTKQMIDIIRASRVTLTHRVLIAIADRLEEQATAIDSMLITLRDQEDLLREMGGRIADITRRSHES